MKHKLSIAVAAAAGLALSASNSQASLSFAGINNAQFNGSADTFQLNPITGSSATPQFNFTGADAGLTGWVTGAPWTVNMAGMTSASVGGVTYQSAPVVGGGQFAIFDGVSTLSGNLALLTIQTSSLGQGGVGNSLSINLTDLVYAGNNPDLLDLVANGNSGNVNMTFQFSGTAPQLSSIFAADAGTTLASFSGSASSANNISSVPEPSTLVAGALLLLPFGISTVRILRKHKQGTV